jgi:hypothetical protein
VGLGLLKQISPATSILDSRQPISTAQLPRVFLHPVTPSWFRSATSYLTSRIYVLYIFSKWFSHIRATWPAHLSLLYFITHTHTHTHGRTHTHTHAHTHTHTEMCYTYFFSFGNKCFANAPGIMLYVHCLAILKIVHLATVYNCSKAREFFTTGNYAGKQISDLSAQTSSKRWKNLKQSLFNVGTGHGEVIQGRNVIIFSKRKAILKGTVSSKRTSKGTNKQIEMCSVNNRAAKKRV